MVVERVARVVPLEGSPPRRLVVLHPALAARYTSLVATVADDIEAGLSPAVAANRVVASSADPPVLRLRPWREERAAFACDLARLAVTEGVLVFADVRECYRSIRPDVVERSLLELGCDRIAGRAVRTFLSGLPSLGLEGLPVGPDPSPVLANAVLARVDRELSAIGVRHLRWVDDIAAGVRGRDDAERVLGVLRNALERIGLELNDDKTRVVVDPAAHACAASVSIARRLVPVG